MATLAERLAEVQATISSVLTSGQEITVNGRTLRRPSLEQLQAIEESLRRQIATESAIATGSHSNRTLSEF